jgi:hypothetical protein
MPTHAFGEAILKASKIVTYSYYIQMIHILVCWNPLEHNILELVSGRPSGYNAKHCSKSLLKREFILFLNNYAHSY